MIRPGYYPAFRYDKSSSEPPPPKNGKDPEKAEATAGSIKDKDDTARVHSARAFEATRHARTKASHAHAAVLHDKAAQAYGDHYMGREHALMGEFHAGGGC